MKSQTTTITSYFMRACCLSVLLLGAQAALALVGPASSPPGGVNVTTTDPGSGEQWGRPNGTLRTYTVFDPEQSLELFWRPVDGNSVQIAFDGFVNFGSPEVLSFNLGQSNLANGVAVWTGSTSVTLFDPSTTLPVPTQFRLTVTSGGLPLSLGLDPISGLPQVDILTLPSPGQFETQLEMLAANPSNQHTQCEAGVSAVPQGTFGPALDVFDCLRTDPVVTELALTSFNNGFFFDDDGTSVGDVNEALALHDQEVQALLGDINADVSFLFTDWPKKWLALLGSETQPGRLDALTRIENSLISLPGQINEPIAALEVKLDALQSTTDQLEQIQIEVANVGDQTENLVDQDLFLGVMGFLWGGFDFTDPNTDLSAIPLVTSLAQQQSVDALEAKADILESKADTIALDIGTLVSKADETGSGIDALEAKADILESKADTIALDIGTLVSKADETGSGVDALESKADALEAKADSLAASVVDLQTKLNDIQSEISGLAVELELEIVKSPQSQGKGLRLIVLMKENGLEVDALISSILAIVKEQKGAVATAEVDYTVAPLATGLVEVHIDLPKSLSSAKTFVVLAQHSGDAGGTTFGSTLYSRTGGGGDDDD